MNKIKFSIRLFAVVLGILLFAQVPSFAATGKSTATNVRVRAEASTNSEVIELLAVDDVVEILSKEGDWYKVSFNGKTGYVSQSFISTNEKVEENNSGEVKTENNEADKTPEQPSKENSTENDNNNQGENNNSEATTGNTTTENTDTPVANETKKTVTKKVYKMAENTGVNLLPIASSVNIGDLEKDNEVSFISKAGLWAYVEYKDVTGWVRFDKISVEEVTVEEPTEATNNGENAEKTEVANNEENNQNNQPEENKTDENIEQKTSESTETNYTAKNMYSKVAAVNVRSEANTSSDVVDSIGINTQVKVVGEQDGWYKVEVNGKNGYIRKDLLSDSKTEVSSRSNDLDRAAAKKEENANAQVTTETPAATAQATQNTPAPAETATSSNGVTGSDIAAYARNFLGCRYVYGSAGPNTFDCSGLTMYVYQHFGYSLSHSSKVQATQGRAVTGDLQPGDILVFSNDGKTVGHVGIYIGNDQFIHAADSSTGVVIGRLSDRWNKSKYWGARRIL